MSDSKSYIEGIHNWCDRWCEHCKYTDRCMSFQMEKEAGIDPLKTDYSDEEIWKHVSQRLAEALELIRKHAVEMAIDIDNLPKVEEELPSKRATHLKERCNTIHQSYIDRSRSFFEENKSFFKEKGHESIQWVEMGLSSEEDAVASWQKVNKQAEVIQWYTFFMGVKMQRAINGIDDMEEDYWDGPEQSDANRTARIVMVAIDRSMAAWRVMLDTFPEKEDDIIQTLALLSRFRRIVEETFPRWAEAGPDVEW